MKIKGNGFLSDEGLNISQEIISRNAEKLENLTLLLNELREFILAKEITWQETEEDKQKTIALIVSVRILEITEAATLIMMHGMNNEANSMFRIFLDAYFIIANVCSDKDFVGNYYNSDTAARLKLLNSVEKHDTELFREINEYASEALKDELKSKIAEENIQAFNSYAYAKNVECEAIYDSMYRLMSSPLHTTPRSLENYVEEDDNGTIISINYFPLEKDIPQRIYDFSYHIIKVISGVTELFGELNESKITKLYSNLEQVERNET